MSDHVVEQNCSFHEYTSETALLKNRAISPERLAMAHEWLTEISLAPENIFASISDDDIRQARLKEHGFDLLSSRDI